MERHFHEQLQELKDTLIEMATLVEKSIAMAIQALVERKDDLADEVMSMDDEINSMELRVDEMCLKLLALQQPMAVDLRFIAAAMKINNDLERMGDHSVNIAERAKMLNSKKVLKPVKNIQKIEDVVQAMVRSSIQAFVEGDVDLAKRVCVRDDEVDDFDDMFFRELLTYMMDDTKNISRAIDVMLVSKNLERIADLTTNIAEEVIFIYDARTIKHHADERSIEHPDVRSRS